MLLISLISGAVLYAPFMQKLAFGEVRRQRTKRLKWLDLHNLLGIVTLVWFLVVGATGVLNAWADLIVKALQIIWAVLDVLTIILLGSGLYLWFAKRSRRKAGASMAVRTGLPSTETRPHS